MDYNDQYHKYRVYHQDFIIDKRYQVTKELGHGAYGIVCSAKYEDEHGGGSVAIKKVTNIFSKKILCKRALRELKLLKHFRGHKNITCLYDLDIIPDLQGNFNEIYLYEELMECDMHQIIRSKQPLTDQHYQSFIYQILCGLKYIHSADVLHRDLKPGNLLVNADCELKICDFGLARGYSNDPEKNSGFLTEYVATRWYRAPEIMLSFQSYTKAIDIWSVGCILAELLGGKPIFRGRDYVDQLNQILCIVGTPKESTLSRIGSKRAQSYVKSLPHMPKVPYSNLFPNANVEGLNLLERMLTLDPQERITVDEALNHPYLKIWNDPTDEPSCHSKFDFSFEVVEDMETMKQMIMEEVKGFREFVRRPIEEQHLLQYGMNNNNNNSTNDNNNEIVDMASMGAFYQQQQAQNLMEQQQQQQMGISDFTQQSPIAFQQQQQQQLSQQQQNNGAGQFQGDFIIPNGDNLPELGYQVPRPQENSTDPGDIFNLEQELEYGLDRYSGMQS